MASSQYHVNGMTTHAKHRKTFTQIEDKCNLEKRGLSQFSHFIQTFFVIQFLIHKD